MRWPLLALVPLLAGSPAAAAPAARPAPAAPQPSGCATALAAARAQQTRLLAAAPSLSVLLLGEIHTSAADHDWQLASLDAIARRRPRLVLGLEMVPAARQAALDRYSAGAIQETAFLQEVGWQEVWGHDPDLYLPLLRWARRQGVPLLALNAEPGDYWLSCVHPRTGAESPQVLVRAEAGTLSCHLPAFEHDLVVRVQRARC